MIRDQLALAIYWHERAGRYRGKKCDRGGHFAHHESLINRTAAIFVVRLVKVDFEDGVGKKMLRRLLLRAR